MVIAKEDIKYCIEWPLPPSQPSNAPSQRPPESKHSSWAVKLTKYANPKKDITSDIARQIIHFFIVCFQFLQTVLGEHNANRSFRNGFRVGQSDDSCYALPDFSHQFVTILFKY